jgi:H+/Cl- antiporter ClcA
MIPGAIILGIIGGCLGPLFINVNTRVNAFRKKVLKTQWILPIETAFFCFFTASVFFWAPYFIMKDDCKAEESVPLADSEFFHAGWCS